MGAGPAAGDGGGGGRPAGAHGDPRQGRLHLRLPQRRHCLAIQGMHYGTTAAASVAFAMGRHLGSYVYSPHLFENSCQIRKAFH